MQFLGQLLGGHALHDPAYYQDDLVTRIARAIPKGASEQIVDFATAPALIVIEGGLDGDYAVPGQRREHDRLGNELR